MGLPLRLRKGYSLPLTAQAVFDSPVAEHQNGLIRFDFIERFNDPGPQIKKSGAGENFLFEGVEFFH